MVFKMLGREQAWEKSVEGMSDAVGRPHQIFVTQSRALAEKVQEFYYKMYNSTKASRARAAEGESAQRDGPLDTIEEDEEDYEMFDLDEEESWRSGLPPSFKELQDCHFPLFLTFDGVCISFPSPIFGFSQRPV